MSYRHAEGSAFKEFMAGAEEFLVEVRKPRFVARQIGSAYANNALYRNQLLLFTKSCSKPTDLVIM